MNNIFDISLIYTTIRAATPILFAALCCTVTSQADILNIGTEGIMLTSAFVSVVTSVYTGNWVLAIFTAILTGIAIAMIMAVANIQFSANICAIGMAVNMFALAITKFGLKRYLGTTGTYSGPDVKGIPRIHIPAFDNIDILNKLFNNWCFTEILGIVMVFFMWFLLFRTRWGLRVRCVGRMPMAAETAGINVRKMRYEVMVISGIMGGLAGACHEFRGDESNIRMDRHADLRFHRFCRRQASSVRYAVTVYPDASVYLHDPCSCDCDVEERARRETEKEGPLRDRR